MIRRKDQGGRGVFYAAQIGPLTRDVIGSKVLAVTALSKRIDIIGDKPSPRRRTMLDRMAKPVTKWNTDPRTAIANRAGDPTDARRGIRCPDYGVVS
jgi:hypothetical protein